MPAILRCELFKLTHRLMPRVLLLLMAGGLLGGYLLLGALPADRGSDLDSLRLGHVVDDGMFIVYQLGMVLAVTLASSTIGSEYGWGTIRTVLPRTSGRSSFLTAKLVSLVLFATVSVLVGFAAAVTGSTAVTELHNLDGSLGPGFAGDLVASAGKATWAILPYGALAFAVALWSRSTAAGVAIPIVAFYAEVLLTPLFASIGALGWIPDVGIYNNITVLLDAHTLVPRSDLHGAWPAAAVLGAYLAAFTAIAFGRFLTRDVEGR